MQVAATRTRQGVSRLAAIADIERDRTAGMPRFRRGGDGFHRPAGHPADEHRGGRYAKNDRQ